MGYSLVEMLVAVAIFSVLGVVMAQTILLSVRTAKRSENTVQVRSEIDQVVNLIENQLRNADAIVCNNQNLITYTDSSGTINRTLSRVTVSGRGVIRWNSNDVSSSKVSFAQNIFICSSIDNPNTIELTLTAQSSGAGTAEASTITVKTEIKPRYYVE